MSTNLWTKVSTLSFKTKATLIAIVLGIGPIATVGSITYVQIQNTLQQQTTNAQKARSEAIADKLNRFIFERNGDVQVLASLPLLANAKIAAVIPTAEKSLVLDEFIKSYGAYDSIAAFDLQGNLIVQSSGELSTKNYSKRQYFQNALKYKRAVISDPEISEDTGKLSLVFAAPIKNTTGQIIGIVRTRTPIDRLETVIKDFATKSEQYHILDRQSNKIFISSNGAYLNQPETPAMATSRLRGGMISQMSRAVNNTKSNELVSVAAFRKLDRMQELSWTAVTTIDEQAAYSELQRLLWTILGGAGFTGLLTLGLTALFADRLTNYIQKTIASITNSANEIVDTVQSQEITVNQQANTAIETTNTINQLESLSTESAAQAASSATGARQALSLSEAGTQAVQQTLRGMSDLRDNVDEIAAQVVNLGEQTGQITSISDLVSDLAKQTNMLALKAAVEAARVGEQGKGFGVVAGEIRKLAEESKKSAEKINNLATDIQVSINRTVMVTDRGTKTVTEGIQLAENTAATFIGVTDAVNNVFLNSQQISTAAKQQATAIQQVLGAMTIVSQGSQESAIGMHKMKTSTRELNQIADELQAVVS
jgi:Methyl-accepting chemotaxis protein (MCP) signalling domain/Cache domain